ncbi:hypothetical protein PRIPAC_95131 [Pristionchus pacificus]|uniref:Uncharacterized protein n=1 Tax=Pristionchus pacificus TaxID=54126 RepID=A0A2A6CJ42_PRIPA|nr:hypothetical protein PRIPAC_95131 [Pristionchus pacificus]|eukprot:PDM78149.1 hypothetical protein PRIPAC_33939 [Pristionchus pacificus]
MDDQSKIERKKAKVREENKSGKSHVMHRATLIQSGPEKGANKWTSVIGDDTTKNEGMQDGQSSRDLMTTTANRRIMKGCRMASQAAI